MSIRTLQMFLFIFENSTLPCIITFFLNNILLVLSQVFLNLAVPWGQLPLLTYGTLLGKIFFLLKPFYDMSNKYETYYQKLMLTYSPFQNYCNFQWENYGQNTKRNYGDTLCRYKMVPSILLFLNV